MMAMAFVKRAAWVMVAGFALGLSCWSLAYVAGRWGVPFPLNYGVSAVFDGLALICADLALRAARLGYSTFAPTSWLIVFAGLSAWFNGYHATLAGLPWEAAVFFASPPIAAVTVVELQLRHDRREALQRAGRIAKPLPAFGGAMWLHKTLSTYLATRQILKHRQQQQVAQATRVWPQLPVTLNPAALSQPVQLAQPVKQPAAPKTPAGGVPSLAGATPRPRAAVARPAAADKTLAGSKPGAQRIRLAPERQAEVVRLMRSDMASGVELSKRIAAERYDIPSHWAMKLLAEARRLTAV